MGTKGQVYGDKLKGIPPEKAVDAVHHGLALCQARSSHDLNAATYNGKFVPAFMERLGLKDVKEVPGRNTLTELYQSHLAKKEVDRIKAESETYNNKKDESDEDELRGSDDDEEEEDGYVGLDDDDDDDDGAPAPAPVALSFARRRRGAPKSTREKLAEQLAPVRDALNKAETALQKASLGKNKTGLALHALGLRGDGLQGVGFAFEDRDYAIKQAERALPDEHGLDLSRMTTARDVWLALIKNHQGLGDGALKERIAATRERCDDLKFERMHLAKLQTAPVAVATRAAAVAGLKRKQINADADADAIESLREFEDDQGALLPPNSTFYRSVKRLASNVPEHVVEDESQLVWAMDAETNKPVLIKAGEMQEKWIFGRSSTFQLGIGMSKDQDPIGEIVRDTAGDAVLMRRNAWNGYRLDGDRFVTHRGRKGPLALCFDIRDRASTWAEGGHDDMSLVPAALGLKLVSSRAVETTVGTLEDFQHARFESTTIPGGLERLMEDCEVLSEKMRRASSKAAGDEVWLAPGVQLERLGTEGTTRFLIAGYSRCAGSINSARRAKLDYLKSEGLEALHYISLRAALLGHIQVRLVGYAHAAAGNFHPDGSIVGPIKSTRIAGAATRAAPANLRSWNFSSGIGGAMPAHMGPAFG